MRRAIHGTVFTAADAVRQEEVNETANKISFLMSQNGRDVTHASRIATLLVDATSRFLLHRSSSVPGEDLGCRRCG